MQYQPRTRASERPFTGREGPRGSDRYAYEHGWDEERVRLAGLEAALDPGTREHLLRLGVAPGCRCLEVGSGGGAVAFWPAGQVMPDRAVGATDPQTDFPEGA